MIKFLGKNLDDSIVLESYFLCIPYQTNTENYDLPDKAAT